MHSVFRSNRNTITMSSILAEHEQNLAVGIEAAHLGEVDLLELKRARAIRKLGRHYQLHPQTTFQWRHEPTVLRHWLAKGGADPKAGGLLAAERAGLITLVP